MWNTSSKKTECPLKIGITGGIGSGKTLICSLFRLIGAEIFEADKVAKEITLVDPQVMKELVAHFGPEICTPEGNLNRQKLASIIFTDKIALQTVNSIVHPLVLDAFKNWSSGKVGPYVLLEAAILFESGFSRFMDANIVIWAPEDIRVRRVMKRDGAKREDVMKRIRNQFSGDELLKLADFIIRNDGRELVIPQVLEMDKRIREYGKFW